MRVCAQAISVSSLARVADSASPADHCRRRRRRRAHPCSKLHHVGGSAVAASFASWVAGDSPPAGGQNKRMWSWHVVLSHLIWCSNSTVVRVLLRRFVETPVLPVMMQVATICWPPAPIVTKCAYTPSGSNWAFCTCTSIMRGSQLCLRVLCDAERLLMICPALHQVWKLQLAGR